MAVEHLKNIDAEMTRAEIVLLEHTAAQKNAHNVWSGGTAAKDFGMQFIHTFDPEPTRIATFYILLSESYDLGLGQFARLKATNRKHDETHATKPWFRLAKIRKQTDNVGSTVRNWSFWLEPSFQSSSSVETETS